MKSLSIHRSYFYYAEKKDDNEVIDSIRKASEFGRKFRVLNILDDFNRSAITQDISISMPAERVIKILEKVIIHSK